ncbi:chemotaxis response regulator protein-glutamate methylesterase [Methyloversatilis sp.]|uniref:protein-glutamate methylesterase/protein-glutamine glutaminase n=1 Tax=Methyloversatilis sp. TaxID=2569862 RepID=UPI002733FA4C|nr:chemotaxis response regulator protein-glutamate methylesterase [Methyloversatilis sp.]MDP2869063.1 chemotaxis response regulator protein-glutamate methylesterase [Methyloversatilis sp.]MDP3289793.1 chemotaxis response regulator protein-glutamate methylesterase [Methyloversatilis sp.]MDP3454513.1 chemotaxis response regulator protein-glutamate methylesterase [Methyloversatilis sp.]MDP3578572.1 chemotaxis response regulator protein-glutamate methylesterase [Methyloversatilis sp.]
MLSRAVVNPAAPAGARIRVLIVDDSAVVRQVLSELLSADPQIRVIATASDPLVAFERLKVEWPDVIVTDVEMPRMDGVTFVRRIMSERPTPIVVCSSLTEKGAETTMEVLAAGAISVVTKPKIGIKQFLHESAHALTDAVKAAARARVGRPRPTAPPSPKSGPKLSADAMMAPPAGEAMKLTTERLVALGTSTGGTQALEAVLTRLPRVCPGIVIVQHMPERFTAAFAERLNNLCEILVKEAVNGDRVMPGVALIAPGGRHMMLKRNGAQYVVEVVDGPLVNRHKPSVDVLFRSVARYAGKNALGIIMTGMGDDGARGLKEMRDVGANTYAQDEESCVVFGMPKEAIRFGAVENVVGLEQIPGVISRYGK